MLARRGVMMFKNSPLNNTSIDLEVEVIKRFRELAPFISPQCRVSREHNPEQTILCLDFTDCPQELKMNQQEWSEMIICLAIVCDYLGIANSVVFKNGGRIVGAMSLEEIT